MSYMCDGDPEHQHQFLVDPSSDSLKCSCGWYITGENIAALGFRRRSRYSKDGLILADECQRLRDENTEILAENARLRRRK